MNINRCNLNILLLFIFVIFLFIIITHKDCQAWTTPIQIAELKNNGIVPMARIVSSGSVGVDPSIMGMGPVPSSKKALEKAGISLDNLGLVEANEAFAVQSIAVIKELGLRSSIVNVNGGAIALGHPIGASGARILVTLLYEMKRRNEEYGLATLCIGGGMGEALIVNRDSFCMQGD